MKKIGIISDTHAWWDDRYAEHFADCDEIWHAGDIGSDDLADRLEAIAPVFRAVAGNVAQNQVLANALSRTLSVGYCIARSTVKQPVIATRCTISNVKSLYQQHLQSSERTIASCSCASDTSTYYDDIKFLILKFHSSG